MRYDNRYHLHLGYYENGADIECVEYKRLSEPVWDIYFDFDFYGVAPVPQENEMTLKYSGTRILSIDGEELDEQVGIQQFKEWLAAKNII
ncbi:DUF3986 family protein [Mesobacillus foraminis]|uniref:DUF3986 family protein n=1 Tax=Mesobacillus foraminis TaxID=279826 RepID=UPI000EF52609|nr:DUF3986 family protein [Mesobacillus foraminis]